MCELELVCSGSARMGVSGSIGVVSGLWAECFGQWSWDAVGIRGDLPICNGDSMGVGDKPFWFWCRVRAWPLSGYTKDTVLLMRHGHLWLTIHPLTLEGAQIQYTLKSILTLTFLSHFLSGYSILVAHPLYSFSMQLNFYIILDIPCFSLGRPMSLSS